MTTEDGLPPLREVIARHSLSARKSLGQNFLLDFNLTARIAREAGPFGDETIIEVGPGPGGLTRALLREGAARLIAIERDDRIIPVMKEIEHIYPGRLQLLHDDALALDWNRLADRPVRVVANLPYNIATALLIRWLSLTPWPPQIISFTLMFQKEVALRLAARPGQTDYGRLSILAQWRCTVKKLFDINRSAFTPPPKVTSSLVQLTPRKAEGCTMAGLERVTAAAFGQRRKMLRQSLKPMFSNPQAALNFLSLNPEARAENLSLEDFIRLAALFESSKGDGPAG